MAKHEEKSCPRCGIPFECRAGDWVHCQCSVVELTEEDHLYIGMEYADCLCANCLRELQKERIANEKK